MTDAGALARALVTLDSLSVAVLTDDVSDNYVSKTPFAVSEFSNVVLNGVRVLSGEALLCANLGYGLRLVSSVGDKDHTMLFDTGPDAPVFLRNCAALGISLEDVEAIAITHGHWDHMAALPATIDRIIKQGGRVSVHVNAGMFNERAIRLSSGRVVPVANVPLAPDLERHGATVVNSGEARLLLDGHFYYSGEIPRVTPFEKGREDHLCRKSPEAPWEPDPLLLDERMLVAKVRGLGLIVFSSCSHAGIVNVCTHVRSIFPDTPIHAVMGGLHLGGVMERNIPDTVDGLKRFDFAHLITGHCTGWRALHAMASAFGDAVSQSAVGTIYTFSAPRQSF
jgi:7,8-dihydropterin-6-yl-methyl-4-(beta-D-ribofuranosyl)aminobenzene 5'-phosphate synthase